MILRAFIFNVHGLVFTRTKKKVLKKVAREEGTYENWVLRSSKINKKINERQK